MRLGTSSWSSKDWYGVFYPEELAPADFISHYSTRYPAVEVDATFYAIPAKRTIEGWARRTPPSFRFAAKVPQVITHEKVLVDCDAEMTAFCRNMELLGERLGPLLLQFPYFNKQKMPDGGRFLELLSPFLSRLPSGFRFAVEVRNKTWVEQPFLDLLRSHNVALALIDHPWFPKPEGLLRRLDCVTADFCYIRWLGDRYKMEETTKSWDKTVLDRTADLTEWSEVIRRLLTRNLSVYAFANNHYGGHAPDTIALFQRIFSGPEPHAESGSRE